MTHQFGVLAGQKGADLRRRVRARIAMVNNESSSLVRFSNFSEEIVVYNSGLTVLHCFRGTVAHMTSFVEETGDYLLRSYFPQISFVRFGSGSKTHTV